MKRAVGIAGLFLLSAQLMLAQMPLVYRQENSGADVKTPRMPPYAELPAIAHLPDPFTMADGTRMTTRDQWRVRWAEIKAMVEKYGAGEKPGKPGTFKTEFSGNTLTMTDRHLSRSAAARSPERLRARQA